MVDVKKHWKQFADWVIDLKHKYEQDVFFSTRIKILVSHVGSVLFVVFVLAALLRYVHVRTFDTFVVGMNQAISTGNIPETMIADTVHDLRTTYLVIFSALVAGASIFGYFLAEYALRPAKQTMEVRRRFIADVSHELRTPLSIMKTNSEVALLGKPNVDLMHEVLHENIEEINRMSGIINNLLSFSNIGRSEAIPFNEIEISTVVENASKKLSTLANKKQVSLHLQCKKGALLDGNETALEQVVMNLVKNAISYTPKKGQVNVYAGPSEKNTTLFTVADSGAGIPQKDLAHIFEPFYRTETSRSRHKGGSGLGLAIVYQIVKMHHGKITIRSLINKGTTVTIEFPKAQKKEPQKKKS